MKSIRIICLGLILSASLYLVSCYDNTVINNEQPFSLDSARFSVTYKEYQIPFSNSYISDTDKIYLSSSGEFAYYKNGGFITKPFNLNFQAYSNIDGFNENNLYIGGGKYISENRYRYNLIKWNGADFEHIAVPDTVSGIGHYFSSLYCKSPNEIWLGGGDGTVWKYDGMNFRKYILDTNSGNPYDMTRTYLLSDGSDRTCCVQVRDSINYNNTAGIRYFKFYRINSNGDFDLLSSINYNNTYGPAFIRRAGSGMYTVTKDGLYSFDGYTFNKITGFEFISHPYPYIAGTGPNDIMIAGLDEENNMQPRTLFHWNGQKWSRENKYVSYMGFTSYIAYVNNMYVSVDFREVSTFIKFLKRN